MIRVQLDTSDIIQYANRLLPNQISAAYHITALQLESRLRDRIEQIFQEAISVQSPLAWPDEYTSHLMIVLQGLPIVINVGNQSLSVNIDLDYLGDRDDLELSFHYHARNIEGHRLSLPYSGESLRGTPEQRYLFFIENVVGTELWDETARARVQVWANRAPEWLYLQYGLLIEPEIRPTPVYESINNYASFITVDLLVQNLNDQIARGSSRFNVVYDPRINNRTSLRDTRTGRFTRRITG